MAPTKQAVSLTRPSWQSLGPHVTHRRVTSSSISLSSPSCIRLAHTSSSHDSSSLKNAITLDARPSEKKGNERERVVVLGSGWAGYALARDLDPKKYERIVISPRSYFVFTPLLASTSVGTLEFRSVLEPVRRMSPDKFHQGWADDIDFANKTIRVETNPDADELSSRTLPPPQPSSANSSPSSSSSGGDETEISMSSVSSTAKGTITKQKGPTIDVPYDKLVLAVGSYSQTFNIPGVREHANFLRDVGDARAIRLRVLQCFERADQPSTTDDQRRKLLHFAIVGGGPTGIEFAAELHDLIYDDLARTYPALMPFVGITVYDIAPKVLPMFDQKLASYAERQFARQGIRVKTEHHLQGLRLDEDGNGGLKLKIAEYGDEEVSAGIVVWSTGLMQNPLVKKLVGKELRTSAAAETTASSPSSSSSSSHILTDEKTGSIKVDDHLRVRVSGENEEKKTLPGVYALGDCAVIEGESFPATAQVASQQAKYLVKAFNKHGKPTANGQKDDGLDAAGAFRFRNLGTMAYLGSWRAIHQSEYDGLTGRLAWVLWRGAYITRSMSIRNKIMVLIHWVMTWLFGRDISRF